MAAHGELWEFNFCEDFEVAAGHGAGENRDILRAEEIIDNGFQ